MGVLDDAIRDHLDLQRRRGASDEEVARKEAEALGPARRDLPEEDLAYVEEEVPVEIPGGERAAGRGSQDPVLATEPEAVEETAARDVVQETELSHRVQDTAAGHPVEETVVRRTVDEAPSIQETAVSHRAQETAASHPAEETVARRTIDDAPPIQETAVSHDVHTGDEPSDGEDVLEDTPDFLQETPDQDRLWFEQKPPRDFDFDD